MINKVIYINNCGRFVSYTKPLDPPKWDGTFSKINTIYAENGFGKTTLTQILKSLSGRNLSLVNKRLSIGASKPMKIQIKTDTGLSTFQNGRWNNEIHNIEVFDSYFAEDNIYSIDLGTYESPSSFYDIVDNGMSLITEIDKLRHLRSQLTDSISNIRYKLKKNTDASKGLKISKALNVQIQKRENCKSEIIEKDKLLSDLIERVLSKYSEGINRYLLRFNPNLRLGSFKKRGNKLIYELYINNVKVRSNDIENLSLRHALSEGDKSALSLSFFLARLELLPQLNNSIIVFDDPISSFDTQRRMSTISILASLATRVEQTFVLSHDLNFIKRFSDTCTGDKSTNIKIYWKSGSSQLGYHDLRRETATDLSKTIIQLVEYKEDGCQGDDDMKRVARCIRPAIEGIFRIKYMRYVNDNQWLGDFIGMIRNADAQSPLYRLQPIILDLTQLNDYSKRYHHSNPNLMEESISDSELRTQVILALSVIEQI